MKLMAVFSAALIGVGILMIPGPSFAAEKTITLEKLRENRDFQMTCGCHITNRQGDHLMFSEAKERASAIVRIDGKRRELRLMSTNEGTQDPFVGETFYRSYRLGDIKMRVNYKTTAICGPRDPVDCEVTKYSVDIRLEEGMRKNHLRNLRGECGC